MIKSPPNSGLVIWADYKPKLVKASAQHSFMVESGATSTVEQNITSSVVTVVAGVSAGLTLSCPGGGTSDRVPRGRLGALSPGERTARVCTGMQKKAPPHSQAEAVETRISFQAVALPERPLPAGSGAIIHKYAIPVAIA